ncbi:C40 family peptidase [Undibacter mobilis]|uniref:Peptidase P60 n=1 Tax=Undibacter mobilis TaxID=2292256 RepID=A0A371BA54_9BRAD|nr:C40 family peptidase [Undibacter mobilis]RDV04460.1 peptidase P60 [Undibacter mobilis]
MALDPRLNPYRRDIAAAHLRGQVEAAHFVNGTLYEIIEPIADLRRDPAHEAALDTEALKGERVTVYEVSEEGWAWGQLKADGYVGYLSANALGPLSPEPTHRVSVPRTFGFPAADIKLPPMIALPMGARLAVTRTTDTFAIDGYGWHYPLGHVAALGEARGDFVALAEMFRGAPYLWGGKSSLGIDCSGLVQVALNATGQPCPRDSYMQERVLGTPVSLADIRRGDLLFWKGHVAIARDAQTLIHANAHHMMVEAEPIAEAIARIKSTDSEITSVKRL